MRCSQRHHFTSSKLNIVQSNVQNVRGLHQMTERTVLLVGKWGGVIIHQWRAVTTEESIFEHLRGDFRTDVEV